jgi:hypothetical protein
MYEGLLIELSSLACFSNKILKSFASNWESKYRLSFFTSSELPLKRADPFLNINNFASSILLKVE